MDCFVSSVDILAKTVKVKMCVASATYPHLQIHLENPLIENIESQGDSIRIYKIWIATIKDSAESHNDDKGRFRRIHKNRLANILESHRIARGFRKST